MVNPVVRKIKKVLREAGLEGILEPDFVIADEDISYKSPLNQNHCYLSYTTFFGGIPEGIHERIKKGLILTSSELNKERELLHELALINKNGRSVYITCDDTGKLMSPVDFEPNISCAKPFRRIKARAGADFVPVWEKMVQLYNDHYRSGRVSEEAGPAKTA